MWPQGKEPALPGPQPPLHPSPCPVHTPVGLAHRETLLWHAVQHLLHATHAVLHHHIRGMLRTHSSGGGPTHRPGEHRATEGVLEGPSATTLPLLRLGPTLPSHPSEKAPVSGRKEPPWEWRTGLTLGAVFLRDSRPPPRPWAGDDTSWTPPQAGSGPHRMGPRYLTA